MSDLNQMAFSHARVSLEREKKLSHPELTVFYSNHVCGVFCWTIYLDYEIVNKIVEHQSKNNPEKAPLIKARRDNSNFSFLKKVLLQPTPIQVI